MQIAEDKRIKQSPHFSSGEVFAYIRSPTQV